jgi:hypothetical protein
MTSKCEEARSSRESCKASVKLGEGSGAVSGDFLILKLEDAIAGTVTVLIYRMDGHVDSKQLGLISVDFEWRQSSRVESCATYSTTFDID